MYVFKPHVFTEHSPKNIVTLVRRMASKIQCDGKNIYIYSGERLTFSESLDLSGNFLFATSEPKVRDIEVYNLARQQWRLMWNENNLPDNNDFICSTIFESNYLVFCTLQVPFNRELSDRICRLHICNLNTKSVLVKETTGQIPYATFSKNLIRHGKYLYVVGFKALLQKFPDVYKLNMENGVWEVDYICPGPNDYTLILRSLHTLVYDKNMIYVFDDKRIDSELDTFHLHEILAFDLEKHCWIIGKTLGDENHIPQYPTRRKKFALTSYSDPDSGEINVIISGGMGYYGTRDIYNDVWRLSLTSLKWTSLGRFGIVLPCQVYSHSMTVSPAGKLFTFGGWIANKNTRYYPTFISTLHSTWLRIPKLTDICWEAVLHYYPNLISMTDEEIMSLGLPLQLLKSRIN